MATREELVEELKRRLEREEGLVWAYLVGSAAAGERFRDLDVACMAERGAYPSLTDWGRLIDRLTGGMPVPVDVIDLGAAPLPFAGPLLEQRVVLLDRDPDRRRDWEVDTSLRWLDFRPFYEKQLRLRREALKARVREIEDASGRGG